MQGEARKGYERKEQNVDFMSNALDSHPLAAMWEGRKNRNVSYKWLLARRGGRDLRWWARKKEHKAD